MPASGAAASFESEAARPTMSGTRWEREMAPLHDAMVLKGPAHTGSSRRARDAHGLQPDEEAVFRYKAVGERRAGPS